MIINDEPLTDPQDVQKYRTGVGTLLYVSSDRPDVQYYVKELAGKLQTPTKGAMASLIQLIGYMSATKDIHIKMEGRNPSATFRKKAEGLSSSPDYMRTLVTFGWLRWQQTQIGQGRKKQDLLQAADVSSLEEFGYTATHVPSATSL